MHSNKKISFKRSTAKLLLAGVLSFGVVSYSPNVFAQTPQPQAPPAPPSPAKLWKKVNPFKKQKKNTIGKKNSSILGLQAPPAPPNPIDIIKNKKLPAPPPPPALPGN